MQAPRISSRVIAIILAVACDSGAGRDAGDATDSADSGLRERDAAGVADDVGRDPNGFPCAMADEVAVGWDEETDLGVPSKVFGPLGGICQATLRWDGTGFGRAIEPLMGESEVTVTVSVDEESARFMRPTEGLCPKYLAAGAHVEIESADGTFVDMGDSEVAIYEEGGAQELRFQVDAEALGGTLAIELGATERGRLSYVLDGAEQSSCAGRVDLTISSSSNGIGMGGGGELGSWSATECPLGRAPYDLEAPLPGGQTALPDLIDEAFGDASYAGTWDDGVPARLQLQVQRLSTRATCVDDSGQLEVPVSVTYSTDDGRIEPHTLDRVPLEASVDPEGGLRGLAVHINDMLTCADAADTLPYTLGSCVDLESVLVQVGITFYGDGSTSFSDNGLSVYEYDRQSDQPPGSADRVRFLELSGE